MSYKSIVNRSRSTKAKQGALSALKDFINSSSHIGKSLGLESIEGGKDDDIADADSSLAVVEQSIGKIIPNSDITDGSGVDGEGVVDVTETALSDSQVDAAAGIMALAGNNASLEAYLDGGKGLDDKYTTFGHSGTDVVGERVSLEQFTDHELKNSLDLSMLYNVRGQRQGHLAELFFRTTTLSPEAPYVKFELYVPNIVKNRKRVITSTQGHQYVRLLDAAINPELLDDRSTDAIPVYQTTGGNTTAFFVPGYTAYEVTVGEETIETAPLLLNTTVNLINLSARPGLVAHGELDNTDGLEAAIRTSVLVGQRDTVFVRFPVANLTEMQFQGADNSTGDKVIFSFNDSIFATVNSTTLNTAGAAAFPALAPTYVGYQIVLATKVSGEFNLNTGVGGVNGGGDVRVVGYYAPDSEIMETALNATLATALDLSIVGYEVRARRTNLAKRVEGTLLASLPIREAYRVELGAPLLAQLPLGVSNTERAQEIATNTLVSASRIRNNNLAIGKLIETAANMEGQSLLSGIAGTSHYVECEGISRHLIRPRFLRKVVDFDDGTVVSSLKSHERAADVSASITNQIRTMSTRLWFESNLESAFQYAADQGNAVKPKLAIGTSPLISQHLIVTGDTRLVGIRFDYEVAYDVDMRLADKIFLAFVSADHQYLTFGQHLWVPELITNLPISRDGRTVRELQVQPRNRHLITLPVLGLIETVNLEKALLDPTLPTIPVEEIDP